MVDTGGRADFFTRDDPAPGAETALNLTDGLRASFASGETLHLRPSGNVPEFRAYAEAATPDRAEALVAQTLAKLRQDFGAD